MIDENNVTEAPESATHGKDMTEVADTTQDPNIAKGGTGEDKQKGTLLSGSESEPDSAGEYTYTLADDAPELTDNEYAALDKAAEMAKEWGIAPGNFQAMVDYHKQELQNAYDNYEKSLAESWDNQLEKWRDTSLKDSELGNSNPEKLNETVSYALKALDKFGSDDLRSILDKPTENSSGLGLGNHPEFIRFASRIGRAISDDSNPIISGDRGKESTEQSRLAGFFPNMYAQLAADRGSDDS